MFKWEKFKLIFFLLATISLLGCALAMTDKYLGDKKATHDDDQSAESSTSNNNNFSKDAE